jgi:hypothetical protein
MRLTDHEINPILSPCLAWFGGGSKGPSKQEKQAAQQQQQQMQQAAAQQAAAQRQQMEMQRQQFEEQKRQQEEMLRQMEANKPAPGAQVDPGNPQADMAAETARRKGMRKSILAGESSQAPMTTGYSTLG